jgi:hypothetical protein
MVRIIPALALTVNLCLERRFKLHGIYCHHQSVFPTIIHPTYRTRIPPRRVGVESVRRRVYQCARRCRSSDTSPSTQGCYSPDLSRREHQLQGLTEDYHLKWRASIQVRFSNDKTPYKRGFSASFSRSGRKGIFACCSSLVFCGS